MLSYALDYEAGKLSTEEVIIWFNALVDNGWIWMMPTDYLDTTITLKARGLLWPDLKLN